MRRRPQLQPRRRSPGFTLAEVAVTIVIVGIGMLLVLQGLNTAKMTAAHTRNYKLARELSLLTLGQVASGLYQEDIENGLQGSYAEEGYPQFTFEVIVGDQTFLTTNEDGSFDTWKHEEELQAREDAESEEDEKDPRDREEPFEKVKIRVTFTPKIRVGDQELGNELVLEEWIPWKQVYGEKEEEEKTEGAKPGDAGGSGASSGAASPAGAGR
jgi:prepilin-type N-terminal cleavage/methylation domain-containing protein